MQLLNSTSKLIVFLLMFFSFFLFTVKSNKRKSNRFFAFFLLLIAFDISGIFLNDWFLEYLFIENLRIASTLLQMPVFYFYVLSVCYADFNLKIKDAAHSILFFLSFGLFTTAYFSKQQITFFLIISEIQYFFYIALVFFALKRYRKIYIENYTNAENLNYKWLIQMTTVLLVAHIFVFSKFIIRLTDNDNLLLLLNVAVMITALLVSSYFVLKALYQPNLFRGIEQNTERLSKKTEGKIITAEINIEDARKVKLLEQFMNEKEPFLDSDLTIQKLAKQIDYTPKELSTLINHIIGKHFFDFVNEYRILKAMLILKNPLHKNLTILEILYEVGFNSKSSFNTAFKKYSNLTPIEYRKQALSNE